MKKDNKEIRHSLPSLRVASINMLPRDRKETQQNEAEQKDVANPRTSSRRTQDDDQHHFNQHRIRPKKHDPL